MKLESSRLGMRARWTRTPQPESNGSTFIRMTEIGKSRCLPSQEARRIFLWKNLKNCCASSKPHMPSARGRIHNVDVYNHCFPILLVTAFVKTVIEVDVPFA